MQCPDLGEPSAPLEGRFPRLLRGQGTLDKGIDCCVDPGTKARFPGFFDKWVKGAGISQDVSFFAVAAGGTMMAATLTASAVDFTGIAAAGFALSTQMVLRSSAALLTDIDCREN